MAILGENKMGVENGETHYVGGIHGLRGYDFVRTMFSLNPFSIPTVS